MALLDCALLRPLRTAPISSSTQSTPATPARIHFAFSARVSVSRIQVGAAVASGMGSVAGAGGVTSGASVGTGVGAA